MDAQPNVQKLAEAFTTSSTAFAAASHEIALVPNLPTFNDGQRLLDAINRVNTNIDNLRTDVNAVKEDVNALKTDFNTLKTDVNTLKTDVTTLKTDVTTMNGKFDNLELRMKAESAYFSPFQTSL